MAENFSGEENRHPGPGSLEFHMKTSKGHTPRHVIIGVVEAKEKDNPESSKRKTTCYIQGKPRKALSRFFSRKFTGQKGAAQHTKVLKGKNFQPRILYP